MAKITLIDLETTGLDPHHHEICEIACIVFDSHTFEIEATYERKVWPKFLDRIDPKAQAVNGYNGDEWRKGGAVPLEVALKELIAHTKGNVLMAFNSPFDVGFLQAAERKHGIDLGARRYPICLRSLAWASMPHTGMFKWSLKEVCEKLGIPPEPAVHRALNGVMCEFEVYKAITK